MSPLRSKIWFGVTVVFAIALIVFTLDGFVLHPSNMIPEIGGDGAKNNFTYLYHCMFGHGYWFTGMNYPFGEHIVYTDGQPVLSVLLASLGNVSAEQALAILWLLVSLSYVLSVLFVYRILVRFRVAPLAAMAFAGLICVFTPQVLRLQGHYALSYTCIIPMLFYWTIKYHEAFHWRYCVYFFVAGCIMSFFHPYYAAMMLIWVVSYAVGYYIFTAGRFWQKCRHSLPMFVSVVLVLVVIAVVMKVTDPVKDRPVKPLSTFYETCTRLKQIITSVHSPVWQKAGGKPRFRFVSEGGEGYVYVGLVVFITMFCSFLFTLRKSIAQKRIVIVAEDTGFSPVWVFMAVAVLLFSMGIPFIWHMEWLLDYTSVFRQFRSFGRFSWIFYYIITVYTCVVLYHTYAQLRVAGRRLPAYSVLLLSLGFWVYEASGYVQYTHRLSGNGKYNYGVIFSKDQQNWASFIREHHYDSTDFQAVLLMPFFHVGTEKLWVGDPDWMVTLGSKASLQLHLPMVDAMMSRSSWSQAQQQVKIAGGCYTDKPILSNTNSDKPFLMMNYDNDTLNPDQKYLISASDYIGHYSQCNVYACYPTRIAANDRKFADSVKRILPFIAGQDTIVNGSGNFYTDHFDKGNFAAPFFGQGALSAITRDDSIWTTIPITPPKDSELYEFSCWFLLGRDDYRSPYITLEQLNSRGKVIKSRDALTRQSTDSHGMWFRSAVYFYIRHDCVAIRCVLMNNPAPTYIAMDELLLRPAGSLVIWQRPGGKVMVNNHLFPALPERN